MKIQIFCLSLLLISAVTLFSTKPPTEFGQFESQSDDVLLNTASMLSDADLVRFAQVSHRLYEIARKEIVKRPKFFLPLWETGTIVEKEIPAHDGAVLSVFVADDGNIISIGQFDHSIKVWNGSNYQLIRSIPDEAGEPLSVAFSPSHNILAIYHADLSIIVWDVKTGKKLRQLESPYEASNLSLSPDGNRLAVDHLKTITWWDLTTGVPETIKIAESKSNPSRVIFLSFSKSKKLLFSCRRGEYRIEVWNVTALKKEREFKIGITNGDDLQLTLLRNGNILAIVGNEPKKTNHIWDIGAKRWIGAIPDYIFALFPNASTWSYDGTLLAATDLQKIMPTIVIWNCKLNKKIQQFSCSNYAPALTFSPDDSMLVAGLNMGAVKVWRVEIPEPVVESEK